MLHIVNKSPYQTRNLESCLRLAKAGSAILLIEDGVYAATRDNIAAAGIKAAIGSVSVYALSPDVEARGVNNLLLDGVKLVDYGGFVDLVAEHANTQSWL
ncbi:MAG: sulfurtransferase complex subunit TusB [Betaproteobacteria bacterium]|nr:sulfurtransferase complex subunit TusB [Betaproteobacteria bacterium]